MTQAIGVTPPEPAEGPITTSSDDSLKPGKVSSVNSTPVEGKPTEGKIALEIGTGDSAKDSFVYLTIKWSFLVGSITTAALFIKSCFSVDVDGLAGMEVVKGVWSVFLPIITLALGYAFGKGR
ncbi:hypothetical protein [Pseudomonas sp. S2_H10]